ncbi:MAG: hypothetical protein WCK51_00820 [Armatimonadota bacterium]
MQNPKFGVTAFTATVLTIICVGKVLLYPYLPPSETEKLVTVDSRKALPAAAVELRWQTIPSRAVEEATKLRKALLWVIIDPRDTNARDLETEAMRDPEVVRLINRYFVPVKLNAENYPEAERLIFPLGRLQTYLRPGATVLVSTTAGRLIGMIRPRGADDRLSTPAVLLQLLGIKKLLDKQQLSPETVLELDAFANAESQKLSELVPGSFGSAQDLVERIQRSQVIKYGGFNSNGYCELRPSTLDLLLELGRADLVTQSIELFCRSAGYDVVGGGIFDGIELGKPHRTIASKSVLTNIAFAETVAKTFALTRRSNLMLILDDILESVENGFMTDANLFEGKVSDVEESGLSTFFSLTGSRIDSRLTPFEAEWVRINLLSTPVQKDYIGRLNKIELLADPMLAKIRRKLVPASSQAAQHTKANRSYVLGFACARLLRIYHLTRDQKALDLFRRLEPTLNRCYLGEGVQRISGIPTSGNGWLGSYLAVSDALLQKYLVLGDRSALSEAQPLLRTTLKLFGTSHSDWLTLTLDGKSPIPGVSGSMPELFDPGYESTTAMGMRVMHQFGSVLQDQTLAGELRSRASQIASMIPSVAEASPVLASGVVCETISQARNRKVEFPRSMKVVPAEFPLEFTVPIDDNRGIYIVRPGRREGPLSLQQAKLNLARP